MNLLLVVGVLVGTNVLLAVVLPRLDWQGRIPLAWLWCGASIAAVERVLLDESPPLRMCALIAVALTGMKVVVLLEAHHQGGDTLPTLHVLAFTLLWPGMAPELFQRRDQGAREGAGRLLGDGVVRLLVGVVFLLGCRWLWRDSGDSAAARGLGLVACSLILHFGVLNLLAGAWRWVGFPCNRLFVAPLLSTSLGEFWGRRWNLAFTEMTRLTVYQPLKHRLGRHGAMVMAFVVSGLLHEMALSVPVWKAVGLPSLFFVLHGGLVALERFLASRGRPISGWLGRVWTVAWLVVPAPLLFHGAFFNGVLWPVLQAELP